MHPSISLPETVHQSVRRKKQKVHNSWYFLNIHSMSNSFLALFSDHYNRPLGWCYYCVHVKLLESCLTLWDPIDYSLPGSSVHRILQTRILERVAMLSSKGASHSRYQPVFLMSSALTVRFFTVSTTWKAQYYY